MRSSAWIKHVLLTSSLSAVVAGNSQVALSPKDEIPQTRRNATDGGKKNIVFILTDDQDSVLDSVSYMPKLKEHIVDKGTSFVNHFVTTAICCPSRVALWAGKQPHNTNVTDVSPPYGK
jgi:hypothetical protein